MDDDYIAPHYLYGMDRHMQELYSLAMPSDVVVIAGLVFKLLTSWQFLLCFAGYLAYRYFRSRKP